MNGPQQFRDFAAGLGYEIPPTIEPGRLFRFSTNGKRRDDAGWGKLFADGHGGVIGDNRTGDQHVWQAKRDRQLNHAELREWRERIEREKREAQAQREREAAEAATRAKEIWNTSKAAPADHGYLSAKRIPAYGLRIYQGPPLTLAGVDCAGALVVPLRNAAGDIRSLEFISESAEKRFLPAGDYSGCYYAIGQPGERLVVVEGFATGATIHKATGLPVRIAATAGNLAAVGRELKAKAPEAKLITAADNDRFTVCERHKREGLKEAASPFDHRPQWCRCNPGVTAALETARAVGGLLAVPELERGTDFNDLDAEGGDIKAQLEAAKPAPMNGASKADARSRDDVSGLVLRRISDVMPKPVRWLWPSRIAKGKVSMLAGHPGLGKSQLCASIAAVVTTGGLWPVDATRCDRGTVLIFSAEDDPEDTIRPRLEAAGADLTRVHVLESVAIRENDGSLTRRAFSLVEDMPRLAAKLAELQDVALVVIDPVTAYMGETDSHKNAEVRAVLSQVAEVAGKYGAAVIAVSHLRKSAAGEAMQQITGSLAFVAAARAAYIVAKDQADPTRRLLLPVKNNLGDDLTGYAFKIDPYTLPCGIGTSRVGWEASRVTVTAEEALAPSEDREERSALEEAGDFLRSMLADAPMPAKRILSEAREAGHAEKTLRRAAKAIGVEQRKEGGHYGNGTQQWLWALKMAKNPEDSQAQTLGTFSKIDHLQAPATPSADDDREKF